ncbi:hypothetical protein [Hanstruepera flava]|uniref:hypothetical protein n=1 Tax=Hanstruepera flava TaxID=2930218 RepID=UPI002028F627|nr:hypothetical protein [Hanstruepera flava]
MKLLLITHDASRSGAPMVLLHFLRWLQKEQPDVQVDVLALIGGAMEGDFKAACRSFYNYKDEKQIVDSKIKKVAYKKSKLRFPKNRLLQKIYNQYLRMNM